MSIVDLTLSNLKLFRGTHGFPDSPEDGLCVNEAAILFAGYQYKSVDDAYDCPPCFSRVIATYALWCNEGMPHGLRNRFLKPFVERIPGTARRGRRRTAAGGIHPARNRPAGNPGALFQSEK
jgi:hypothetical protein